MNTGIFCPCWSRSAYYILVFYCLRALVIGLKFVGIGRKIVVIPLHNYYVKRLLILAPDLGYVFDRNLCFS